MKRKEVESSNIRSIGWSNNTLEIEFNNGIYQYLPVDKVIYRTMMDAESKGKYFHEYIKGQFEVKKLEGQAIRLKDLKEVTEETVRMALQAHITLFTSNQEKNKVDRESTIAFIKYWIGRNEWII